MKCKAFIIFALLCMMVRGAWAQGTIGGMPFIPNIDKARITDVGGADEIDLRYKS